MAVQLVVLGPERVLHQRLLGRRHAVRLGREVVVGELRENICTELENICSGSHLVLDVLVLGPGVGLASVHRLVAEAEGGGAGSLGTALAPAHILP